VAGYSGPVGIGNEEKRRTMKINAATLATLRDYFVGRRNPYAVQQADGTYLVVHRLLVDMALYDHLQGDLTIGTYTIDENGKCRNVVWDIDTPDITVLYRLLDHVDPPYIVEWSGNKGYHVWKSYDPKLPADVAYEYGLQVKEKAGVKCEHFPKQPHLDKGGFGNLVKLPFGKHRVTGDFSRHVMGDLEYSPPPAIEINRAVEREIRRATEGDATWLDEMFGGVGEGERNNTMNRFVYWLYARNFPVELVDMNARFVNEHYFSPPLEDAEIDTLVRER
jgi:hypothetical protein